MSHFPETSIFKEFFNIIQQSLSNSSMIPPTQIESILRCLNQVERLPIVNWDSILLTIFKSDSFGVIKIIYFLY